nr:hypothetical protein BaRGS_020875 [Batillaria attramentaria]
MCKRWWIYILYFLLDTCISNAFVVMSESPNHQLRTKTGRAKARTLLDYRQNLAKQLIGLKKKLLKLACEKECGALQQWIKSICNHLYWVAVSTPDADGQLMLEKWCSLSNHLHNKHQHKGAKFPRCQHPDLEGEERNKNWIKAGTKLSAKLTDILESRQMMKDVPMLSTGPQTASIEGFHSVLNHFAPKMYGFSYSGILHRNVLAAPHFNENNERKQATRLDGTPRFRVAFKKARKSFALEPVKISCTYGTFRQDLYSRHPCSATASGGSQMSGVEPTE